MTEIEKVLDIPAFDMTDARLAKGAKVPRDGSVGKETFDQVEALVKQGKSKSDAFKQIASDSGRNVGTVSANYYRVARSSGAVKPRKRSAKAASTVSTRKTPPARRGRA